MELHDLVLSKICVGRPKDIEFCQALNETGYVNHHVLMKRLPMVNCTGDHRHLIEGRIKRYFPVPKSSSDKSDVGHHSTAGVGGVIDTDADDEEQEQSQSLSMPPGLK